jgi:hypothetical protein
MDARQFQEFCRSRGIRVAHEGGGFCLRELAGGLATDPNTLLKALTDESHPGLAGLNRSSVKQGRERTWAFNAFKANFPGHAYLIEGLTTPDKTFWQKCARIHRQHPQFPTLPERLWAIEVRGSRTELSAALGRIALLEMQRDGCTGGWFKCIDPGVEPVVSTYLLDPDDD